MLDSLGFSPVTFAVTIFNIVILCIILRAVLFKPLTKFMAERAKRIQDSIDQAEQNRNQAKAALEQYEAKLKAADADAEAIVKAARENAESEAAKIIAGGKAAAESLAAAARRQIDAEHQAALAKFRTEAAALVLAASSRLVARSLAAGDNRRYAEMLLEELAAAQGGNG